MGATIQNTAVSGGSPILADLEIGIDISDNTLYYGKSAVNTLIGGGGGAPDWGDIGGTLSDQTDLQDELDDKQDASGMLDGLAALSPTDVSQVIVSSGTDVFSLMQMTANKFLARDSSNPLAMKDISNLGLTLVADSTVDQMHDTLGLTDVGRAIATVADPSAIRFLRVNADDTVTLLSDSDFRTAIGVSIVAPGEVSMFGMAVPSTHLECDGTAYNRTTYANLFSAIGTSFGIGDGSTTFNVPDFRGRAPLGVGTGASLTARALAASGGAESVTLSTGEIPAHAHSFAGDAVLRYTGSGGSYNLPSAGTDVTLGFTMNNTGGGGAHNNMQPWLAVRFGIKT